MNTVHITRFEAQSMTEGYMCPFTVECDLTAASVANVSQTELDKLFKDACDTAVTQARQMHGNIRILSQTNHTIQR